MHNETQKDVTNFLDEVSYQKVLSLSVEDKNRFFQMMNEHSELLLKMMPALKDSIIFLPLSYKKIENNNNPLIEEYIRWKSK